ncbi:nucleotidyl transferase AbiEii/AbiGii toxin family protein [Streptomyces sp. NPDC004237]|uniref:nucleotidyl transferase AbiEii/AbiGii toxin family protein n=1 Tax=Streptomyces sp. NPDC004237 TaxID=3154455 RepID=UPI0033A6A01C
MRPASSPLGREHFVLRGGLLLAQFGARRTTRDIDVLGRSSRGTETEIIRRVTAAADRRRRRVRSHDTQDGPHPRGGRGRPGSTADMTDPGQGTPYDIASHANLISFGGSDHARRPVWRGQ